MTGLIPQGLYLEELAVFPFRKFHAYSGRVYKINIRFQRGSRSLLQSIIN